LPDNPLVTGPPRVRFYAGAPLAAADGSLVGTLCLIDQRARQLDEQQLGLLRDLADLVEAELADPSSRLTKAANRSSGS
jgi:GAF domain-containing protein